MTYTPDPAVGTVIASAVDVHKALGPGLLESVYQRCLAYEFAIRTLPFVQQVPLPISYKGLATDCGYRLDFIVDRTIIVEIKCVDRLAPIHSAQLLTYLKLAQAKRGLLINFNVPRLVDGVRSFVL
jgi:GxxExxY protein